MSGKLTKKNVASILKARVHGKKFAEIAKSFDVTVQAVRYHCIKNHVKKYAKYTKAA